MSYPCRSCGPNRVRSCGLNTCAQAGGPLEGYGEKKGKLGTGALGTMNITRNLEDR